MGAGFVGDVASVGGITLDPGRTELGWLVSIVMVGSGPMSMILSMGKKARSFLGYECSVRCISEERSDSSCPSWCGCECYRRHIFLVLLLTQLAV
jgi:hypothetical protein